MTRVAALALVFVGGSAFAAPPMLIPRLDPEGFPLPREALRRLGSARFLAGGNPVAVTPDGKTLITCGNAVIAWDLATGHPRWTFRPARTQFQQAAHAADGQFVWVVATHTTEKGVSSETEVVRLAVADGKELTRTKLGLHNVMDVSPTGRVVVSRNEQTRNFVDGTTGRTLGSWTVPQGERINEATLTSDGQRVAIGTCPEHGNLPGGSKVRVVDTVTGQVEKTIPIGGRLLNELFTFQVDAEGRHLYALVKPGSWSNNNIPNGSLHGWDLKTGQELFAIELPSDLGGGNKGIANTFTVSPDGKTAAVGGWNRPTLLYDLPSGKVRCQILDSTSYYPPLFDPTGRVLMAGGINVTFWDTTTGKRLPHSPPPYAVAYRGLSFSEDGTRLTARPYAGSDVVEWDPQTGREMVRTAMADVRRAGPVGTTGNVGVGDNPITLRSPDGRLLARFVFNRDDQVNAANGTILLSDARTGQELNILPRATNFTQGLAFSPDGRYLVSDVSNMAAVYDTTTGKLTHKIQFDNRVVGNTGNVLLTNGRLYPCPDGRHLAVLEFNTYHQQQNWSKWSVGVYELSSGKEVKRFRGAGMLAQLCWSADGTRLVAAGAKNWMDDTKGGVIFVGDLTTDHPPLPLTHTENASRAVAISPDGRTLAVGDGGTIQLYEVATGQVRHSFVGHRQKPGALAFSPDGRQLASSGADGTFVWDVAGELSRPAVADLDRLWADLTADDPVQSFRAIRRLAAIPDQSLPFLKRRFDTPADPDIARIPGLVQQLDAPAFAKREAAQSELTELGAAAIPALRIAAKDHPSAEVRKRAQRILARPVQISPDWRWAIRAVEVLTWIGSEDAIKQLQHWASGPTTSPLTAEAKREAERPKP